MALRHAGTTAVWDQGRARRLLERHATAHAQGGCAPYAITRHTDATCIGLVGLAPNDRDIPEFGCLFPRRCWRQGYLREAAAAILPAAQRNPDIPEIVARIESDHPARLARERTVFFPLGFTAEGGSAAATAEESRTTTDGCPPPDQRYRLFTDLVAHRGAPCRSGTMELLRTPPPGGARHPLTEARGGGAGESVGRGRPFRVCWSGGAGVCQSGERTAGAVAAVAGGSSGTHRGDLSYFLREEESCLLRSSSSWRSWRRTSPSSARSVRTRSSTWPTPSCLSSSVRPYCPAKPDRSGR
ncbi:GNAT family N-acetyltransferase [Streptomyces smyrnaeus]|uniref:GNAT family N-acetyltransferase n=1 Tax=Streptomyces smyrnaeus TaxID=1387713 RepID=A0ABS3Y517_9ACTN|nr:GNAT family N-acetyltransferase [Streptomyces smyrnaeus]